MEHLEKEQPAKKQLFHLFKIYPLKFAKMKLFGEIKKYGNFDLTGKNIEKNIIDQSHVVHKNLATPLSFGPLKCCSVKWEVNIRGPPSL